MKQKGLTLFQNETKIINEQRLKEVREMQVTMTELEELIQLRHKVNELELKLQLLEKAVEFLADKLDDTDNEIGLKANNLYLIKQILQK